MLADQIHRRDALQCVAWILGGALSAELTAGLMGQILNIAQRVPIKAENTALLAEIADVIIPSTNTPGAKAAKTEEFVVRVLHDCYPYSEQEEFYRDLEKLKAESQKRFSKAFAHLDSNQKHELVLHAAKQLKGFFLRMRQLTIAGYFSSEVGATQALEYLPIPGRFEGAVPMNPGQKAWAI